MANPFPEDFEVVCGSEEETRSFGCQIGTSADGPMILSLEGALGAGKTCFVQGLAAGCGVDPAQVSSPTFTLVHEYPGGRLPLVHFDLYRLESAQELVPLGFEDYLHGPGICAIEWGDKFPEALPAGTWRIRFFIEPVGRRLTLARVQ